MGSQRIRQDWVAKHSTTRCFSCVWPTVGDPVDYSMPGCSVHGILQARILEWVAISFSRVSSQPRDWTCVSYVSCVGEFFTTGATWEAQDLLYGFLFFFLKTREPKLMCLKNCNLHLRQLASRRVTKTNLYLGRLTPWKFLFNGIVVDRP